MISNFGLQMKDCHLATLNFFMLKPFYLTIATSLEGDFLWLNKNKNIDKMIKLVLNFMNF